MDVKFTPYDPAEELETDAEIAVFMNEAMKTGDSAYIAHALGVVARAKGMNQIAKETGLQRENLYRALREGGNPTMKTFLAVIKAMGIQLQAVPRKMA